jgi:hypothetical protein
MTDASVAADNSGFLAALGMTRIRWAAEIQEIIAKS